MRETGQEDRKGGYQSQVVDHYVFLPSNIPGKDEDDCEMCPPGKWCKMGEADPQSCTAGYFCQEGDNALHFK